jgi:hypothetical protein
MPGGRLGARSRRSTFVPRRWDGSTVESLAMMPAISISRESRGESIETSCVLRRGIRPSGRRAFAAIIVTTACSIYVTNSRTECSPVHYKVELHEAVHVSDYAEIAPQTPEECEPAQERREAHMAAHAEAQAQAAAEAAARNVTRRTGFALVGAEMSVPKIVRLARDVATEHVERFLELPLTPPAAGKDIGDTRRDLSSSEADFSGTKEPPAGP